jgi:glutamyl-Q tRNA(Asp) synthetase
VRLVSRFAPSPTGRLHLGHAYTAVLAEQVARVAGGLFLLRIEDIDEGRCRPAFVDAIIADLKWLGLEWDGAPLFQSQRTGHYVAALNRLHALGLTYVCTCTRTEIAASAPQGPMGPIYPGMCRNRAHDADPKAAHCWRLDMQKAVALAGPLTWHDASDGEVQAHPLSQGDIVIARKDAAASYHLAVTVDDAAQDVTDIVRGRDLFEATHIHCLLQALLGLPTPRYHHHPLVVGPDGKRLAKRDEAPTLASLREAGTDGLALTKMLRAHRFPVGFSLANP